MQKRLFVSVQDFQHMSAAQCYRVAAARTSATYGCKSIVHGLENTQVKIVNA